MKHITTKTKKWIDAKSEEIYNKLVEAKQISQELTEFYMTCDDTRLRWNGADLFTRDARKFPSTEKISIRQRELKLQPSYLYFPINPQNITRRSREIECRIT